LEKRRRRSICGRLSRRFVDGLRRPCRFLLQLRCQSLRWSNQGSGLMARFTSPITRGVTWAAEANRPKHPVSYSSFLCLRCSGRLASTSAMSSACRCCRGSLPVPAGSHSAVPRELSAPALPTRSQRLSECSRVGVGQASMSFSRATRMAWIASVCWR
jgi:hypothetical protein